MKAQLLTLKETLTWPLECLLDSLRALLAGESHWLLLPMETAQQALPPTEKMCLYDVPLNQAGMTTCKGSLLS